jgi:hypothetical protein
MLLDTRAHPHGLQQIVDRYRLQAYGFKEDRGA